ncbi:MAG TPA: hypothetical protein ACQGQH_02930 [Xylella sp.]
MSLTCGSGPPQRLPLVYHLLGGDVHCFQHQIGTSIAVLAVVGCQCRAVFEYFPHKADTQYVAMTPDWECTNGF